MLPKNPTHKSKIESYVLCEEDKIDALKNCRVKEVQPLWQQR